MKKKAVFFDIDGTLWDEKSWIPDSTRAAISKLKENGHLAFICTGRTKGFVRDENLLSLGFDGIIAGCGTYIEYNGKQLYYHRLENTVVANALQVMKDCKMVVILEGRQHLYLDAEQFEGNAYAGKLARELGDDLLRISGNENRWEVSKFSAAAMDDSYFKARELLADDFDCLIHGMHAIEFVPKGFSKASGIQKACGLLEIDREDTYAFGDSVNDLDMLSYVAHGIAMGNGTDEAKQTAEYVTSPLKEDGIYHGLEHYGLI